MHGTRSLGPHPEPWGRFLHAMYALGSVPVPLAVVLIAVGVALSYGLVYAGGGAAHVPPHWFYVPLLVAAVRFGPAGVAGTAVVSALVAGPLLPASVATGASQHASDWLLRGGFFVGMGLLMSGAYRGMERAYRSHLGFAQRERQLTEQATAIVRSVSHEFRTPLTLLRGGLETLHGRALVSAPGDELVEAMIRASQRLEGLVMVVLTATDQLPRAGAEEVVDVARLCRQVADRLGHRNGPERVRVNAAAGACHVISRPAFLMPLLAILLDNALKFSPAHQPVDVSSARRGTTVELAIRDRGKGIPADQREHLFDAFVQLDEDTARAKGGLGLGLGAAQRLAGQLDAAIDLAPHGEQGTVAILRLPQRRSSDRLPAIRPASW